MSHSASVEVAQRQELERRKAIEKYGEIATESGGHPDLDVIDYALNELVGLIRYGEMIQYRAGSLTELKYPAPDDPVGQAAESAWSRLQDLGVEIETTGRKLAVQVADARRALVEAGVDLGEPEHT